MDRPNFKLLGCSLVLLMGCGNFSNVSAASEIAPDGLVISENCNGDPLCVEPGFLGENWRLSPRERQRERRLQERAERRRERSASRNESQRPRTSREAPPLPDRPGTERASSGVLPNLLPSLLSDLRRDAPVQYDFEEGSDVEGDIRSAMGEMIQALRSGQGDTCADRHFFPVLQRSTDDPVAFRERTGKEPASEAGLVAAYSAMLRCMNPCLTESESLFVARCEHAASFVIGENGEGEPGPRCSEEDLLAGMRSGEYFGSYRNPQTRQCERQVEEHRQPVYSGVDLVLLFDISGSVRGSAMAIVERVSHFLAQEIPRLPFDMRVILGTHVPGLESVVLNPADAEFSEQVRRTVERFYQLRVEGVNTETLLEGLLVNVTEHLGENDDVVVFVVSDSYDQSFLPWSHENERYRGLSIQRMLGRRLTTWRRGLAEMRRRVSGRLIISSAQADLRLSRQVIRDRLMDAAARETGGRRVTLDSRMIEDQVRRQINQAVHRRSGERIDLISPPGASEVLAVEVNGRPLSEDRWSFESGRFRVAVPSEARGRAGEVVVRFLKPRVSVESDEEVLVNDAERLSVVLSRLRRRRGQGLLPWLESQSDESLVQAIDALPVRDWHLIRDHWAPRTGGLRKVLRQRIWWMRLLRGLRFSHRRCSAATQPPRSMVIGEESEAGLVSTIARQNRQVMTEVLMRCASTEGETNRLIEELATGQNASE